MKRNHTAPKKQVYRTYPLIFWQHCSRCKMDFRRAWSWRYLSGPYYNGSGHWRYLCSDCAATREAASQLAATDPHIGKRPPAPPAMGTGVQRP
jgi:hypothetical protein